MDVYNAKKMQDGSENKDVFEKTEQPKILADTVQPTFVNKGDTNLLNQFRK